MKGDANRHTETHKRTCSDLIFIYISVKYMTISPALGKFRTITILITCDRLDITDVILYV